MNTANDFYYDRTLLGGEANLTCVTARNAMEPAITSLPTTTSKSSTCHAPNRPTTFFRTLSGKRQTVNTTSRVTPNAVPAAKEKES